LLTQASHDRGIDEVMVALDAHRGFRAGRKDGAAVPAHREREFLEILGEELQGRVERRMAAAAPAELLARVRRGEVDPYSAALEILSDATALARLLGGDP
jgi:putative protein kinase ArgK-like GTPase of G3E family